MIAAASNSMLTRYLIALLLTVAVEGVVAYLLGFRRREFQLALAAINLVTNPMLNYSLAVLGYLGATVSLRLVVIFEIVIVFAEWGMLVYTFSEPRKRFLLISIVGNAASFGAGLLLFWT